MKTALIKTSIWRDNEIYNLNLDTKLLYLFLTTSPDRNTTRFYRCPDRLISAHIGLTSQLLELCKKQLEAKGLVYFVDGWVVIGDDSYVCPTKGKLTATIYKKDMLEVPSAVLDFAKSKELSTELSPEESSGATQEHIYINNNNASSGFLENEYDDVWELTSEGHARLKRI